MFPTAYGSEFVTPMLLVPDAGPVSIWDDSVFSALGFGAFVPIDGGELVITQDVTTTRHLSILSSDGFVDTGDSTLTLLGDIVGDGILVKDGTGTLRSRARARTTAPRSTKERSWSTARTPAPCWSSRAS